MGKNTTYLIDLDGTMYCGNTLILGAKVFIDWLLEKNIPFLFLTNNATRTARQNVEHMERLGFQGIREEHFFTSAMASARYVAKESSLRKAFVIGMEGLREALLKEGFQIVEKNADFVFVGLDKNANYRRYSDALAQLLNGAQLIGTNFDRMIATSEGFDVGNGAIVHMLEYASGQTSPRIGKPYAPILELAMEAHGLTKEDVILIGDNLETDIRLGYEQDVRTIFVTTGVHHPSDMERLAIYADRVVDDLRELISEE